jgi:hypothetical protein
LLDQPLPHMKLVHLIACVSWQYDATLSVLQSAHQVHWTSEVPGNKRIIE